MTSKPKVVVVGAGFGGLETAFMLRYLAGDALDIEVVADRATFVFKPNTIYIPFGSDPDELVFDVTDAFEKQDVAFREATAFSVDTERRELQTSDGVVSYDYLVLATGAAMREEEVPGLHQHGISIWSIEDMTRLATRFEEVEEMAHGGETTRVLFLVPPGNKCSGPLYEIALMLDTWSRRNDIRDALDITFATTESGFIQAFGPRLHTVVEEEFRERHIHGHLEVDVERVENGIAHFKDGSELGFDLLIAFPPYVAGRIFDGLPHDGRGFVQTDLESRRVVGAEREYAVGDVADIPVKQAFLALLQGEAAASAIASEVLGEEVGRLFDPVSMCVMDQYDKATFAQVPLEITGDPDEPVRVREGAEELYKVGSSKAWRAGKLLLGHYLPHRFRNGWPFHAGAEWAGMEMGLDAMASMFSD